MSHKPESRPTIFIDMKKSRIRIHRRTLQMLGNPTHIQLLVNPDSRTIAVADCRAKRTPVPYSADSLRHN